MAKWGFYVFLRAMRSFVLPALQPANQTHNPAQFRQILTFPRRYSATKQE
jgi:hypothetical protein